MFLFYLAVNCKLCHLLWVVLEASVRFFQALLCCFDSALCVYPGRGHLEWHAGSSAELRALLLGFSPPEPFTGPYGSRGYPESFLFFLQLERCQDFFCSFSCLSHATLWLMPTIRAKPLKAGKPPTLLDAPRFECPHAFSVLFRILW